MIYTGYFEKLEDYRQRGLVPVCIAGYAPSAFTGIHYKQLAPKKIWWQEWHDKHLGQDWYKAKYQETVLDKLSAKEVETDMKSFGKNVVLLCYEKPNQFCHRQLVRQWLNKNHILSQEFLLYPLNIKNRPRD